MTNWIEEEGFKEMIANLVEDQIRKRQREIPEHLGGNIFRVPPAMKEYMERAYKEQGGQSDFYYRTNMGYGIHPIMVDFQFRKDSITMVFCAPSGDRLFILELVP